MLLWAAGTIFLLSGCAGTIPVVYQPQNFVRYQGRADVGTFIYAPSQNGNVAPNQIENTAMGSIYIGADVAEFVRRATALELEKTGVALTDNSPIQVRGDVLRFKANDLGYSVDWMYCVRYRLARKSDSREVLNAVYKVAKKSGKFGMAADYTPSVNELILSGYDQFIRDENTRRIFASSPEDLTALASATASPPPAECVPRPKPAPIKLEACSMNYDCKVGTICYEGACRRL
jgi:hypothetical protein